MSMNTSRPHILVVPWPGQGHVNCLLHLSHKLVDQGFKITFVNTDYNHKKILSANPDSNTINTDDDQVNFISIPDGMDPQGDRTELGSLCDAIYSTMPANLEDLIRRINSGGGTKITCVLVDLGLSWLLQVAGKLGIKGAVVWPMSTAVLVLEHNLDRLIHDGIIDDDGFPLKSEIIQIGPGMPLVNTAEFIWYTCGSSATDRKLTFKAVKQFIEASNLAHWWLCNSILGLEPEAFSFSPKLLPIGPLMDTSHHGLSRGQFWSEDSTCLQWLDQQEARSVIYIAFGSFTIFDVEQFHELALGLQQMGRPFLWVVRPGLTEKGTTMEFPEEFRGKRGKVVSWAPQVRVLSHPSIACFVSHCGWNSTMEGLMNGVPFLCWPYFADQMMNKSYICDIWKVGLGLEKNKKGIVTGDEVRNKVEQLLADEGIRERSSKLKDVAVSSVAGEGQSSKNFHSFINWLKTLESDEAACTEN